LNSLDSAQFFVESGLGQVLNRPEFFLPPKGRKAKITSLVCKEEFFEVAPHCHDENGDSVLMLKYRGSIINLEEPYKKLKTMQGFLLLAASDYKGTYFLVKVEDIVEDDYGNGNWSLGQNLTRVSTLIEGSLDVAKLLASLCEAYSIFFDSA
jgi:hypothetical protein